MKRSFLAGAGARLVDDDLGAGSRAILPDHRSRGRSAARNDPARCRLDVLVADAQALAAALRLTDEAPVGYLLGARGNAGMLAVGKSKAPRR